MTKSFGFSHLRLSNLLPKGGHSFGMEPPTEAESTFMARPKWHGVFQDTRTQTTHVFTYEDTPEGRQALASQCRVERLMSLILGHQVDVETAGTIRFQTPTGPHTESRRTSST